MIYGVTGGFLNFDAIQVKGVLIAFQIFEPKDFTPAGILILPLLIKAAKIEPPIATVAPIPNNHFFQDGFSTRLLLWGTNSSVWGASGSFVPSGSRAVGANGKVSKFVKLAPIIKTEL